MSSVVNGMALESRKPKNMCERLMSRKCPCEGGLWARGLDGNEGMRALCQTGTRRWDNKYAVREGIWRRCCEQHVKTIMQRRARAVALTRWREDSCVVWEQTTEGTIRA